MLKWYKVCFVHRQQAELVVVMHKRRRTPLTGLPDGLDIPRLLYSPLVNLEEPYVDQGQV